MLRAARAAADEEAAKQSLAPPLVIAVTMLTSMSQETLTEIGLGDPVAAQVTRLAALAQEAALDGVVASAREIAMIRERCDPRFLIVTPGIRGAGDAKGDQRRTMSAGEAVSSGANYLVVGRPIVAAADPAAAAARIAEECQTTPAA
jgi:orotidine-5'-phosphate decarboxylase